MYLVVMFGADSAAVEAVQRKRHGELQEAAMQAVAANVDDGAQPAKRASAEIEGAIDKLWNVGA